MYTSRACKLYFSGKIGVVFTCIYIVMIDVHYHPRYNLNSGGMQTFVISIMFAFQILVGSMSCIHERFEDCGNGLCLFV